MLISTVVQLHRGCQSLCIVVVDIHCDMRCMKGWYRKEKDHTQEYAANLIGTNQKIKNDFLLFHSQFRTQQKIHYAEAHHPKLHRFVSVGLDLCRNGHVIFTWL